MTSIYHIITLCVLISCVTYSQVNLVIQGGTKIHTLNGALIKISGDLDEKDEGYLKGKVISGIRSSISSFAGLTFNSELNASISRTTGNQYSINGAGKNVLRQYQIINNSTTTLATINSKINEDEFNEMLGPFFIYTYDNKWNGYGDGMLRNLVVAEDVIIKNGIVDIIFSEGVGISSKIFLEAPYDATNSNMRTTLNPYLPLTSPYFEDQRVVSDIPNSAVDWILIQLVAGSVRRSRAVFIDNNGYIIDDNGSIGVGIPTPPGNYQIIIDHKSHLPIMSSETQNDLTWGVLPTTYDFTSSKNKFYGTDGAKELEDGIWGMWCGDTNGDKQINDSDKQLVNNTAVYMGYHELDINFDGTVTNADKYLINENISATSQVP